MVMNRLFRSLAASLAIAASGSASAHHSFARFDRTKTVVLTGIVKEFQWTNPHAWIQINVKGANGRAVEWGAECGSPNMMVRSGWKKSLLKPGDTVTITVNPLRDGGPNGSLVTIKLADGTVLGPGDTPKLRPLGAGAVN
jgi:Family of unknown function (DUF6152)